MNHRSLLVLGVLLVLLAGCSGVPVASSDTATPESDAAWSYRIVVENGYDTQPYTLTVATPTGQTVLNETRSVASGDRWVATTLTEAEHGGETYVITVRPEDEDTVARSEFDTTPREKVTYRSGAKLYRFGPDGSAVHLCGGSPDCYTNVTTE
ncbi:hypothetical protein [Halobaculum litoreum]|uniref:Lipoprotein n=1 Tax=Halobaculum litoreum TaxID=3031998 RepID=A0ABD5XS27_9EURY|nr:hypothetical protein [Halobaculum sp. DT92]